MTHFAWFSSRFFKKSFQRDYRKISNDAPKTGTKLIGAQKKEISISADGDFGEMKKTESWQVCVRKRLSFFLGLGL